jgi:imidazolonepropionase-like amidohydrolase
MVLVVLLLASVRLGFAQEVPQTTVLINGTVIDATGQPPIENATVIIEGNRISEVRRGPYTASQTDENTRVLDLEGGYVLPGLWNNHSHLADLLPDPKNMLENEPLLRATIRAGRNAMDALKGGFTSLRMTGERDFVDVAWKQAFDAGVFVGPRIVPSGNPISVGDDDDWLVVSASNPSEIRQIVQNHVANGAEIIKIIASRMNTEEIFAAIDEAHKQGVPVTAHSGGESARIAVEHGVDGIEHGNRLSDDTIRLMAEKNVFLDPTIVCNLSADYVAERERLIKEAGFDDPDEVVEGRILVAYADERSPEMARSAREVLNKAFEAGVKIITGSDSNPIDEIGLAEIEQLVFSGIPEMGAIMAATRNSAEMVGMLDDLGTVEAGKLADLIVVEKSPLENISNLRTLSMVIKDGKLVNLAKDEGQTSFWKLYFLE